MTTTPTAERGLEHSFASLQSAADQLLARLDAGRRTTTRLRKGVTLGDVSTIRKALDELANLAGEISQSYERVVESTPTDASLQSALGRSYLDELVAIGRSEGLSISELDGRLIAFPVIVETNPEALTVKIGRATTRNLRPSAVIAQVRAAMRRARSKPDRFIELLYTAAQWVNADNARTSGVRLDDVYKVLTLHPETKKSYSQTDFAVDLFTLDTSEIATTKKGARVFFHGSTGAKGSSGSFTIIGPDARPRHYVSVRFEEEQR